MTETRKRSTFLLEILLIMALAAVAYSQIVIPVASMGTLTHFGQSRTVSGKFAPLVAVTLDLRTALKDPDTSPYRFPEDGLTGEVTAATGVDFLLPTHTQIQLLAPDTRQRAAAVGTPVLRGMVAIAVLLLLLRMVRTLRLGDPFVPANAHRMYLMAATVGVGLPVADLVGQWGRQGVLNNPRVAPLVVPESYHLPLLPIAIGLAIAVAAEVFRQGASMRTELAGLV
jgi:hypothetical protein